MNKVDQVKDRNEVMLHMLELSKRMQFVDIVPISAKQGKNTDVLKSMFATIYRKPCTISLKSM